MWVSDHYVVHGTPETNIIWYANYSPSKKLMLSIDAWGV